jgi:drug/metabolite transporter (DMT)-like permease
VNHAPEPPATADPDKLKLILALGAVYLIWSSTYLGMKVVVQVFPPMLLGAIRFALAGLVLLFLHLARRGRLPTRAEALGAAPVGLLMFVVGNGFLAFAQRHVTSGVAAIVASTTPLWAAILGPLFGDRARRAEWLGMALGTAGVVILGLRAELGGDPLMIAGLLMSPVGWALGSLLSRRLPSAPGLAAPGLQMLAGALGMAIVALVHGDTLPHAVPTDVLLVFAYLVVFGSLVGYTAFSWLLRHTRPALALSYSYVNPVIALVLGVFLGGESLHVATVLAAGLLVIAVVIVVRASVRSRPRTTST